MVPCSQLGYYMQGQRTQSPRCAVVSIVTLTCDVCRERATGIEPAFSAWEAHEWVSRDLRLSEKGQLTAIRTYSEVFAVTRILSSRVARNCANSRSGTLWHDTAGRSQPRKLRADGGAFAKESDLGSHPNPTALGSTVPDIGPHALRPRSPVGRGSGAIGAAGHSACWHSGVHV